jgi:hypothetical protein
MTMNGDMILNDEMRRLWKKTVRTYFKGFILAYALKNEQNPPKVLSQDSRSSLRQIKDLLSNYTEMHVQRREPIISKPSKIFSL